MADVIKKVRIKKEDGTFTNYIPIGADAENVITEDGMSIEDKLNKKPYYFNNITEMKAANYLIEDDCAITLGYYEPNDGGSGTYQIVKDDTLVDDGGSVHDLLNGNKAKLLANNTVNVKQFGAKGDGVHNDDSAFITFINSGAKMLIIPNGTYLVEAVAFPKDVTIEGNNSIINCLLETTRMVGFNSNSIINNLKINSLNEDREWNRIDLRNKSHIEFNNCKFSGYRQSTISEAGPNVWALYLRECHDMRFVNCEFENNSFQDILIESGTRNIYFENINSSNNDNGVIIDIEPEQIIPVENISIINSNIKEIAIMNIQNTYEIIKNITIIDSIINLFDYRGGKVIVENSIIKDYKKVSSTYAPTAGNLKLINSAIFSENMIPDPYFMKFSKNNENSFWTSYYLSNDWNTFTRFIKDSDGYISLALNPNNLAGIQVIQSKKIQCNGDEPYMLRTLSRAYYPSSSASGSRSIQAQILFYDDTDNLIFTDNIKLNHGDKDVVYPYQHMTRIFVTPTNCSSFQIRYRNADTTNSSFSLYLRTSELFKLGKPTNNFETNNIHSLPPLKNMRFTLPSSIIPNADWINHFAGDIIYNEDPQSYVGKVLLQDGNTTWKNFGTIDN